jgi:hypothetical protein
MYGHTDYGTTTLLYSRTLEIGTGDEERDLYWSKVCSRNIRGCLMLGGRCQRTKSGGRFKSVQRYQVPPDKRSGGIQEIDEIKYRADNFMVVKVLLPV